MKFITVSRKKLGITIILIGFIIVLLGFAKCFESRLGLTSLIRNDKDSMLQYAELNGRIKYKLPSEWYVKKQEVFGDEILCHTDFKSRDNKINGFFQVWKLNGNLETFLKNSKLISNKQNLYKSYSLKRLYLDGKKGYLLKYDITKEIGNSYIGQEYFWENGQEFYRFSFFVKENDFKQNMSDIFKTIAESLKYN